MDPRNYKSGAAASPPDAPAAPSNGYPTEGNPGSGVPATNPGPFWYYKVGESLRNIITTAGLTPDDGDLNLLQKAIVKLVSATNHVVRLEDVTFGPSVSDGDAVYWDNANSRYDRSIADGTDKQKMVGFADVTNSLVEAFGRSSLFSGLTAGARYYLSSTVEGGLTTTAPSEKISVGIAKSPTTLFVDIDPDKTESATYSLSTNGYIVLPPELGSLILQWGVYTSASYLGEGAVDITLPIAFPNAAFTGVATGRNSSQQTAGGDHAEVVSISTTTLKVFAQANAAGNTLNGFFWLAIGY